VIRALQHECPRWEGDERNPSSGDAAYVWPGKPRYVSARRARKLRKRGVPLMPCHRVHDRSGEHRPGEFYPTHGDKARYAWFEPEAAVESRERTRALHCYLFATRPEPFGRKGWLAARLDLHRARHLARRASLRLFGTLVAADEYAGKRYAKFDTPAPPNEARALLGDKLSDELLAQRDTGQHYDNCDCAACDGSLDR